MYLPVPMLKVFYPLLDLITSLRGSLLYRGVAGWAGLSPGTSGQVLTSGGSGADPLWSTISSSITSGTPTDLTGLLTGNGAAVSVTALAAFDAAGSAAAAQTASLQKSSNLSDLVNASTARTNLGVPSGSGTSTGTNTGDQDLSGYATTTYVGDEIDDSLAAFTGSSAITTVGTIAVGTWSAGFAASSLTAIVAAATPTALGTSGAVVADLAVNNQFTLAPTGGVTLSVSNSVVGSSLVIVVDPSAYAITWGITGLVWVGGSAPTLPTTAGHYLLVAMKR